MVIAVSPRICICKGRYNLQQCFQTAGPRVGTEPWHQLYRAARDSPGSCLFRFL